MAVPRAPVPRDPALPTFEWKARGEPGFNRTIHQIVENYYYDLGCDVGNEFYWKEEIQKDATSIAPTSKYPITHVVLMFSGVVVVGFSIIRAGKLCVAPEDETEDRAVCKANQRSWYIEFICSAKGRGFGATLMGEIQRAAMERGVEYICLSALPSVIMFYHNLGYKLTLNLECLEQPRITELAAEIRADIKRRKDAGMPQLREVDEMLADPTFNELLIHAVREKLSTIRNRGEECKDTKSCVEDGVYMLMCLPKKQMELSIFGALPVPEQMDLDRDMEYHRQFLRFDQLAKQKRHL